jgi:MYXO-CTERM domain-containing protein
MQAATGSGAPSCGGRDTRLNHATCAINRIVNSYGDMVFALGRFRETTNGTFSTTCDGNLDAEGNVNGAFPTPSGGDQCSTQGLYCGNCQQPGTCANNSAVSCTSNANCPGSFCDRQCRGGNCATRTCVTNTDCGSGAGGGGGSCVGGLCTFGACSSSDRELQMLTALVDGNNQLASQLTYGSCASCSMPATGTDPTGANEIWGVSDFTFTPLAAVLNGAKLYWLGQTLASDGTTTIWPSNAPGFNPIVNDAPVNTSFLAKPGKSATCNPNPNTCDNTVGCTSQTNCCCLEQCRPMITILLTDGEETCSAFTNTTNAASSLLRTDLTVAGGVKRYRVETKPIGFGINPGNAQIEAIAQAGGAANVPGNEGFYASNEADLQLAISSILDDAIKTETCNNLDDDCDLAIDEDFEPAKGEACDNGKLGVCRREGFLVCKADGTGLACNAANGGTGSNEVCNNLDDDCDGKTDEGLLNCVCSPQAEQCNNRDDDCDTRIDEGITRPCGTGTCQGTEFCQAGAFVGCNADTPEDEECNGLDENCDGVRDGFQEQCSTLPPLPPENFPIDDPRNNPGHPSNNPIPENICRPGVKVCPANVGPPNDFGACQFEIKPCNGAANCLDNNCNNIDEDCDNDIDEGFQPADCSSDCGVGQTQCIDGVLSCNAVLANDDDSCDGIDDDCDLKIDEDFACSDPTPKPGFPSVCNPKPFSCDPSPSCTGTNCCCRCECTDAFVCQGTESCVNGDVVCQGDAITQESCDCNDNNCNGQVDEGNLCGAGSICSEFCQCAFDCGTGEFPCPLGKFCKTETQGCSTAAGCDASDACTQDPTRTDCCCRSLCIADPCFGVTCPPVGDNKQVCQVNAQGNQGTCVDACSVANCAPLICIPETGECKPDDCTTFPDRCAENQNCINGVCITNLCKDVDCPTDQYCVAGNCVASCADVECPSGQRCRLGVCEDDPCDAPCPFGQACNDNTGECVTNGCSTVNCPTGQWCNPNNNGGTCENDPCVGTSCPSDDEVCVGGTCFDPDDFAPDGGVEVNVTTGGGGGCTTGGNGGEAGLLLLGVALLFVRRRRGGHS